MHIIISACFYSKVNYFFLSIMPIIMQSFTKSVHNFLRFMFHRHCQVVISIAMPIEPTKFHIRIHQQPCQRSQTDLLDPTYRQNFEIVSWSREIVEAVLVRRWLQRQEDVQCCRRRCSTTDSDQHQSM